MILKGNNQEKKIILFYFNGFEASVKKKMSIFA